jgi:hypothetical protein
LPSTQLVDVQIKKNTLFTSKLNLYFGKKLVNCYIWSIASCGAETWILQQLDQKCLESFEMWYWRRMEKTGFKEERNALHNIKRRKANWTGHILRKNCLLEHVIEGEIEGRIEVMGRRVRRRQQLLENLDESRGYRKFKKGNIKSYFLYSVDRVSRYNSGKRST